MRYRNERSLKQCNGYMGCEVKIAARCYCKNGEDNIYLMDVLERVKKMFQSVSL